MRSFWHIRTETTPIKYTFGGRKVEASLEDTTSLSIAVPFQPLSGDNSDLTAVAIASFKDMPADSPRAGRISTPTDAALSGASSIIDPLSSKALYDNNVQISAERKQNAVESNNSVDDITKKAEEQLKRSFLDILGDQLIASLITSPVVALEKTVCLTLDLTRF